MDEAKAESVEHLAREGFTVTHVFIGQLDHTVEAYARGRVLHPMTQALRGLRERRTKSWRRADK